MRTEDFMTTLSTLLPSQYSKLLRPAPIARTRSKHPVAVCTRCAAFSFDSACVDEKCERFAGSKPCPGMMKSTANREEWQLCTACHGTGWQGSMVCMHCQSIGWRFFRKYYG